MCTDGECVRCRPLTTCNGRGLCNEDGTCNCFSGWAGNYCEISMCPGDGCSGHGLCGTHFISALYSAPPPFLTQASSKHVCKCIKPWAGEDCSSMDIFGGKEPLWLAFAYAIIIPLSVSVMTCVLRYSNRGVTVPILVRGAWAYVNGESDEHNSDGSEGSEGEIEDNNNIVVISAEGEGGGGGGGYEDDEEKDDEEKEGEEEPAVEDIYVENER